MSANRTNKLVAVPLLLTTLVTLCFAPPEAANAAVTVQKFRTVDYQVLASSYSNDGCVEDQTYLDASFDRGIGEYFVAYARYAYDYCTDIQIADLSYEGEGDLTVDASLSRATLTAEVWPEGYDPEPEDIVRVTEFFTATGPRVRGHDTTTFGIPGEVRYVAHYSGVSRSANASGTFDFDVATISKVRSGYVVVTHYSS